MIRLRTLCALSLLPLAGCFQPVEVSPEAEPEADSGRGPSLDGGADAGIDGGSGGCASDDACPAGQVCEGCSPSSRFCILGCRSDSQCPAEELCVEVQCVACPCPPQCEWRPCVDKDGDGFVKTCGKVGCGGKGNCDCDDSDPAVNRGAAESCGNGKDDDCNGLVDAADPVCQMCPLPSPACGSTWDCSVGQEQCANGCCKSCPPPPKIACGQGECALPAGIDPGTGCSLGDRCVPCCVCPAMPPGARVCGANGATYESPCEAQCAGTEVLHYGGCLPGEGMSCPWGGAPGTGCGSSKTMYCRDACPMCDAAMGRCTQLGACAYDWDCPAGVTPPACADGTAPKARCVSHRCEYTCP